MTFDPAAWTPPRCEHRHIILACPHDDCAEQNAYIDNNLKQLNMYQDHQRDLARQWVRAALGLANQPRPEGKPA